MKLSIIIPAYNEELGLAKTLPNTLARVADQSRDVEIVLVNNASTDKTGEIARSFALVGQAGVKVVDEPNKGLVRARQAGFINSSGELIANVDADSLIPAGWIERVFKEFEKDPKLVALSGPYIYYDLPAWLNFISRFYYGLGLIFTYFSFKRSHHGAMLQGGNFILRRTALEKIGGYRFEKFDFYGEETDVAMRICEVGKIKFSFKLPMFTSGRRLREEGIIRASFTYGLNFLWTTIFGRPYTKKNIDIRLLS
jgi:glycosyltransferase involved in cell wall biosynthesis